MTCRESTPHDVGEPGRNVIERLRPDERLVCRRQHRQARSEARAKDANALESLRMQPCHCAPCVKNGLAAHLYRAHDVRADDVVGACKARVACAHRGRAGSSAVQRHRSARAASTARCDPRHPRSIGTSRPQPGRGPSVCQAEARRQLETSARQQCCSQDAASRLRLENGACRLPPASGGQPMLP